METGDREVHATNKADSDTCPSPSASSVPTAYRSACLLPSSAAGEAQLGEPRLAHASFLRGEVAFGEGRFGPQSGQGRLGYTMPPELLESCPIYLHPIHADATLAENGFELLDVSAALESVGVTEETFDPYSQEHRKIVGAVLIAAAEARFGKRAVHLADTSRISGNAVYGEVTVRNTTPGSTLRAAQHIFHLDKFLPGIAKLYGKSGDFAGARRIVDAYWHLWGPDFEARGVSEEQVASYTEKADPGMLNLWVSLTPGKIVNEPLAVADMRNILLDDSDIECVSTHAIVFPGLLEDTITVMRKKATAGAKLVYRPDMRFGEVLLFSTTSTPHSAVWLDGQPAVGRCSGEIRLLLVDRDGSHDA